MNQTLSMVMIHTFHVSFGGKIRQVLEESLGTQIVDSPRNVTVGSTHSFVFEIELQ